MRCGRCMDDKSGRGNYPEPVMYTGNGTTTDFPLPDGCDGNHVVIKAPNTGIKIRVARDQAYEVVHGYVRFLNPPPKDTVISFVPDSGDVYYRGEWDKNIQYDTGELVSYDGYYYIAKQPSQGEEPGVDSDYWTDNGMREALAGQVALNERMDLLIGGATEQDNDFAREVIDARINSAGVRQHTLGDNIREIESIMLELKDFVESHVQEREGGLVYTILDNEGKELASCDKFGNWTINGNVEVLHGLLKAAGRIEASGDLAVQGSLAVNENAEVAGILTVDSNAKISGGVEVGGGAAVQDDAEIGGTLEVKRGAQITGDLGVEGDIDLQGALDVAGRADIAGVLTVDGNTTLERDAFINGDTEIAGHVEIKQTADIGDSLSVGGDLVIQDTEFTHEDSEYLAALQDKERHVLIGVRDSGAVEVAGDVELPGATVSSRETEYLYTLTDANGVMLVGITANDVYLAAGITKQAREAINEAITALNQELSARLESLSQEVHAELDKKVDKVSGQSLINEEFSQSVQYDKTEYLTAIIDHDNKPLAGIKSDGSFAVGESLKLRNGGVENAETEYIYVILDKEGKILMSMDEFAHAYISGGLDTDTKRLIRDAIMDLGQSLEQELNNEFSGMKGEYDTKIAAKAEKSEVNTALAQKVDKVTGKGLVDTEFADGVSQQETEYLYTITDKNGAVLAGIDQAGVHEFSAGVDVSGTRLYGEDSPEYAYLVMDQDNKVLAGIDQTGNVTFGVIPPQIAEAARIAAEEATPEVVNDVLSEKGFDVLSVEDYGEPFIMTDSEGRVISEVTGTGAVNFPAGASIAGTQIANEDSMGLLAIVDNEGHVIAQVESDGSVAFGVVPSQVVEAVKSSLEDVVAEKVSDEIAEAGLDAVSTTEDKTYLQILTDNSGKILQSVDADGVMHIDAPLRVTNLQMTDELSASVMALNVVDWSNAEKLNIPEPRCAYVNFSGISAMPTTKTANLHAYMEFWDMHGNYFKKKVIMGAQGNASLGHAKKNIKFDLCNDDWIGDETFDLKIGDWVEQDGFHLKAYYTEFFRGIAVVSYKFWDDILKSRGIYKDRPYKKIFLNLDSTTSTYGTVDDMALQVGRSALCHPDGFPCIVYLNGEFYGIFSWQIKKQRKNYMLTKSTVEHIHLDGNIYVQYFWNGTIDWTQFEIRNPNKLYCMDGSKYDGDVPLELIDESSEKYKASNKDHKRTAQVKKYITDFVAAWQEFRTLYNAYESNKTDENLQAAKDKYETLFDVENQIDYLIFSDIIYNWDGVYGRNVQITTYDGVKWFLNAYDLDYTLGNRGGVIDAPLTGHSTTNKSLPHYYVVLLYKSELENRYRELRDKGVINTDHIISYLRDWCSRVGEKNYEAEYEKWPNSSCNNDNIINSVYWKEVDGLGSKNTYNAETAYSVGDTCYYGSNAYMGFYKFECIANCTGIAPISAYRQRDSIYRVYRWLTQSIANMDKLYNYTPMVNMINAGSGVAITDAQGKLLYAAE